MTPTNQTIWQIMADYGTAMLGAIGAVAHWFQQIMDAERVFVWWHFPMMVATGAFLGHIAGLFAVAIGKPELRDVAAGAFGATGALGFRLINAAASKLGGPK